MAKILGSYHSVAGGVRVRVIQRVAGPGFIRIFLMNSTNDREDLVYDPGRAPPTCLQQLSVWANEFWQLLDHQRLQNLLLYTVYTTIGTHFHAHAGFILTKPCI